MIRKFKIWLAQKLRKFCDKYDPFYDYAKEISLKASYKTYVPSKICAIKEVPIYDFLSETHNGRTFKLWEDEETIKKALASDLAKTLIKGNYLEFEKIEKPKQNKIIFYAILYVARKV